MNLNDFSGGDLIEEARNASGVGERRSISPREKSRQTPTRRSSRSPSSRKSKSPLSAAPPSQHTPAGSPPLSEVAAPSINPALLVDEGGSDQVLNATDKTDINLNPQDQDQGQVQVQETARVQDKQWNQPIPREQVGFGGVPLSGGTILPGVGWRLQTSDLKGMESQPRSSSTDSPATPLGLSMDGIYADQSYDISRQSSMTDLGSYLGATKGISTNSSSESGYDMGGYVDPENEGGPGVPPPKGKKSHARKQPPGHIKRARNAFILFRKHVTDSNLIPTTVEVKHQNISVVAAKMWREAPQEVRKKFQEEARVEKEEHQRKYPGYRYQPVFRRTDIIRRRVRKDASEDEKVVAVAEALIKGKAGGALEKEMKDQMTQRSEASESDAEGSVRSTSRRRRREVGQLSKGAIRAQRAQARAKQLRQNLLGSNLLSMSMYNAQAQNQRASIMPHHPGAQYAMAESYLPMGYDLDGRPNMQSAYPVQEGMYAPGPGGMVEGEMYRLPPIDHGMMQLGYDGMDWDPETGEYYPEGPSHPYETHPQEEYYPQGGAGYNFTDPAPGSEYRLPPLEASRETGHTVEMGDNTRLEDEGVDPRMRDWAKDGLQTPSGHVQFNARLFDGALGSAGLQHESRDAGLSGFDEAITQANEVQPW